MPLGMLGKYERLDVLGHGVSGIVYLAKDTLLNKQVALKEVDVQSGDLRRFLEEARVMDRLSHPNIVRVNSVDRIEGKVVIDMEYVRGENLQDLLRREFRLSLDYALDICAQVLDALDYAHRMQTVHRDIKPANILIDREGTVKLVDFGLAEILATNAYAGGAGTYAYMAPEDFAEEAHSDSQSDIWAVGVTLYEMLTAQRPFPVAKVKDPFAWKRALETETAMPVDTYMLDAPPDLQTILDRALARDKRDRYPTAGEFRDAVVRLRAEVPSLAPAPSTFNPSSPAPLPQGTRRKTNLDSPFPVSAANEVGKGVGGLGALGFEENATVNAVEVREGAGPGFVVADVNADQEMEAGAVAPDLHPTKPTRELPKRKRGEARLSVVPGEVDFGVMRKGEQRAVKVQVRVDGIYDPIAAFVKCGAAWIEATPTAFNRPRQAITLTAHSSLAWETGDFQDTVHIDMNVGSVEIPVRVRVLKPRPQFHQIALWYVPLVLTALLPVLCVAFAGVNVDPAFSATLVPPAAIVSGLLSAMLLLVGIAADLGVPERIVCGVLTVVMGGVLGAAIGAHHDSAWRELVLPRMFAAGSLVGVLLILQVIFLSRWKLWATALACLGIAFGAAFLHVMLP